MPILDLYASRVTASQGIQDVWVYDRIPDVLRVQVSNLIEWALGSIDQYNKDNAIKIYRYIETEICHEHGRRTLIETARLARSPHPSADVLSCVQTESNVAVWLNLIELSFRCIEKYRGPLNNHSRRLAGITIQAESAVHELNERFRRAGFGYRYENGKIVRVDSEFLHQEATGPDPPPLKWFDLRYVFDIQEDCNGKETIQA